ARRSPAVVLRWFAVGGIDAATVVDQHFRTARAPGEGGPLPGGDDQADDARDDQDQADRPQVQSLHVEVGREAQDRPDDDQEDASGEGHLRLRTRRTRAIAKRTRMMTMM